MNAYTFVLPINFVRSILRNCYYPFSVVSKLILLRLRQQNSSTKRRTLCKVRFGLEAMLLLLARHFVAGETWARVLSNVQFNRGRV